MADQKPPNHPDADEQADQVMDQEEEAMLDADEADEEIQDEGDVAMDSDAEDEDMQEEIQLHNDSSGHFDQHKDSIFCIVQHPIFNDIIATGGGDDVGYIFRVSEPKPSPLLPKSYESNPQPEEREGITPLFKLEGHEDSISAIAFTQPEGKYVVTAGLDGRLRVAYQASASISQLTPANVDDEWRLIGEAKEVEEINWLLPCPSADHPNVIALGANDGSVWVYQLSTEKGNQLQILQAYYLHTMSCTAGAWSSDGSLLCTVAEDGSLYVHDVFDQAQTGQAVISLTGTDERFKVEGGLYSVAVAPNSTFVAAGGAGGQIRIVGLPLPAASATSSAKGAGAKSKAGGGKQASAKGAGAAGGQAGQILASLQAGDDSVETIAFSTAPLTLMAVGTVDGSIVLYDHAHRFATRRKIVEAHEGEAVIKVEFVSPKSSSRAAAIPSAGAAGNWLLTSCGNDGVVRRWDTRGGTTAAGQGLKGEWRGHRGGGEGGGILGFVQGKGERVVTAGDDGVSLVFETPIE